MYDLAIAGGSLAEFLSLQLGRNSVFQDGPRRDGKLGYVCPIFAAGALWLVLYFIQFMLLESAW
jgi:hypothetical protein